MWLLRQVNGVSSTSPTYAALAAVMLLLCCGFMVWWLTVVVHRFVTSLITLQRQRKRQATLDAQWGSAVPSATAFRPAAVRKVGSRAPPRNAFADDGGGGGPEVGNGVGDTGSNRTRSVSLDDDEKKGVAPNKTPPIKLTFSVVNPLARVNGPSRAHNRKR